MNAVICVWRLWRAVQIVAWVKDHTASVIENGKLARAQLKQPAERWFGIPSSG